jgi:hypothetical protein
MGIRWHTRPINTGLMPQGCHDWFTRMRILALSNERARPDDRPIEFQSFTVLIDGVSAEQAKRQGRFGRLPIMRPIGTTGRSAGLALVPERWPACRGSSMALAWQGTGKALALARMALLCLCWRAGHGHAGQRASAGPLVPRLARPGRSADRSLGSTAVRPCPACRPWGRTTGRRAIGHAPRYTLLPKRARVRPS